MKISTDRILTTHTGSLPRPMDLSAMLEEFDSGEMPDRGKFESRVRESVSEVVKIQVDAGVDVVSDGEQALELGGEQPGYWDIIFMDCEMPVMDGYQATREIRTLEQASTAHPHCWIIALSAHATGDYVQKARDAGVDDYLSKPVSQQQVREALHRGQVATP